jgi:hypothetical protein
MSTSSSGNFFLRKLKYLDAYPKTLEDFRVKTFSGAAISIACVLLVTILFVYEWQAYMTLEVNQQLFVDIGRGQKFHINVDITFPHLPCKILSVDSMDVSGAMQIDVVKSVKKRRLNKQGHDITDMNERGKRNDEEITTTTTVTTSKQVSNDTCGPCYGAETDRRKCCNTCDEVKLAYREKNWQFSPFGIEQCKDVVQNGQDSGHAHGAALTDDEFNKLLDSGEGCRLVGYLEVNRVAGNFHIAPGSSHQHDHAHVHDVKMSQISRFNSSHTVNRFYFGEDLYPNQMNPLENTVQIALDPNGIAYSYFIKIVPTTYEYNNGDLLNNTYQYSVTKYQKPISLSDQSGLIPGFFVTYELSPIMVKFIEKKQSFTHFLTSCCAIIGGLFTVAGLLDSFVYRYYNLYKKSQINKLT